MISIKNCIEKIDSSDSIEVKLISVKEAINAIGDIKEPKNRKDSFLNIAARLPKTPEFQSLYAEAINNALDAADAISDRQHRIHALLCIANELSETEEAEPLQLRAMRLALNLKEHARYSKGYLEGIAKELPKSSDYSFYRQYTLLGVAKILPKTGEFLKLYKDAIETAIAATDVILEPSYRKYALIYIANELPKTSEFQALLLKVLEKAFKAATDIIDPLIKTYNLIDILNDIPIASEFFPLLQQILKDILSLFSMKMMFKGINATEIIDYILVAEEKGINESKKAKYTKIKYAVMLAKELDRFGSLLNDIRFIEILKPYTYVWVQPKELRLAIKRIVDRLEGLQNTYHGKEIERPVFVKEVFHPSDAHYPINGVKREASAAKECLSIDIGATNTVIMKRRRDSQPEFISLEAVSRQYDDVPIIPTFLDNKSNTIGAEAVVLSPVSDFKKMLLEGRPEGREYMEKYLNILCQHLKKEIENPRWFSIFSNIMADRIYVTVPVGFPDYKRNLKDIMERILRGAEVEFLEEPLAAAIGYQVAEKRDRIVMVIDFGGNTLDVMMLRLNLNDVHVIAKPDRSKMLGGRDIDIWLGEYLSGKIGMDNESFSIELINKAEEIKIDLSNSREAPFHWNGAEVCRISRDDFEEILAKHDFYKTVDRAVLYVLHRAKKIGVTKEKIEAVLLTGGSSLIPSFKEKIEAIFPELQQKNAIYNHSPFSAVAMGAALYGTRNIIDRHFGLGYAIRYTTKDKENPYAYEIIFEKGEPFPFEKTFKIIPARTLGEQRDIYIELFEAPESHITRRWEKEGETEIIKQVIKPVKEMGLKGFSIITLSFEEPFKGEINITFLVNDSGYLLLRYGKEHKEIKTDIRLQ